MTSTEKRKTLEPTGNNKETKRYKTGNTDNYFSRALYRNDKTAFPIQDITAANIEVRKKTASKEIKKLHDREAEEKRSAKKTFDKEIREGMHHEIAQKRYDEAIAAADQQSLRRWEQLRNKVTSGGAEHEWAMYYESEAGQKSINETSAASADIKAAALRKDVKALETRVAEIDKENGSAQREIIRQHLEIEHLRDTTATPSNERTNPLLTRFQHIEEEVKADKNVAEAVDKEAKQKSEKVISNRLLPPALDRSIVTDKSESHEHAENSRGNRANYEIRRIFRETFIKDQEHPTNNENKDVDKAMAQPAVQKAIEIARAKGPLDDTQQKENIAALEKGITEGIHAGMEQKLQREETNRRFLTEAKGMLTAHTLMDGKEGDPDKQAEIQTAKTTIENHLQDLKVAHPPLASEIEKFQDEHGLAKTHEGNANALTDNSTRQKAESDARNNAINTEKAAIDDPNNPKEIANYYQIQNDKEKTPDATFVERIKADFDGYKRTLQDIHSEYNHKIEVAKKKRDKDVRKVEDTLTKKRNDAEKARQKARSGSHEAAEEKFAKTVAEADQEMKSAKAKAEEPYNNLVAERAAADAEALRRYPLAEFPDKLKQFKESSENLRNPTQEKADIEKIKTKLESKIKSYEAKAATKRTDWSAEKYKANNDVVAQTEVFYKAKAEHAAASSEAEKSELQWKAAKEEIEALDKHISSLHDRLYYRTRWAQEAKLTPEQKGINDELIRKHHTDINALSKTRETRENERAASHAKFLEDDDKRRVAEEKLRDEESKLDTYKTVYEHAKTNYDSDERKRERQEDRLRELEKMELSFQRIKKIQADSIRAAILAQAFGNTTSTINQMSIGHLRSMMEALQK